MSNHDSILSETDRAVARRAVLEQYRLFVDEYLNIQNAKSALDQRAEQLLASASDCFAAARVLQFNETDFAAVWEDANEANKKQLAFAANQPLITSMGPVPKPNEPQHATDQQDPNAVSALGSNPTAVHPLTLKDRVLVAAEKAYPAPVRVSGLRQQFAQSGTALHEKSLGVALYRWSKEGRMRRDGRDWYYVPANGSASLESPHRFSDSSEGLPN